jgi:hypothetical protein
MRTTGYESRRTAQGERHQIVPAALVAKVAAAADDQRTRRAQISCKAENAARRLRLYETVWRHKMF